MAVTTASLPISTLHSRKSPLFTKQTKKKHFTIPNNFANIVRKDLQFLKQRINFASESLHLPKLANKLNDLVWLRHLEKPNPNPNGSPEPLQPFPQPHYPGLTGVDLVMADVEALKAYGCYLRNVPKMLSRPLPEVYDAQEIEDYFSCRPHIVTLRLIEVFISFTFAAIKLRTSGFFWMYGSGIDKNGNSPEYYFGQMLKETMLSLGPTFIKVGQSLSTRPDIIGPDISKALSELYDRIPPFPRTEAMQIIEDELGSPIDSIFSHISEEPVAAASFGQVYQGSTLDGSNVAIKVQRPNLHHVVVRDIYILRLGLGLLQKVAKRKSDLRVYADELGKGLVGELDYTLEAANASEFREVHSRFPFIFVPKIYKHLSRKRVLTMEWVVGENPNELLLVSSRSMIDHNSVYSESEQLEAKKRLLDLVSKGVESSLVQLLETGLLHADPHPGNLRYTASGQIGFLDFGLMCRMEKKHQFAMLSSIVHIVNGDWSSLVQDLADMDVTRAGTNIRRVTMDLEYALGDVEMKDGIPDVKFSRVLGQIWSVALKYHFRMPPYYTLVLRSLASLEGLAVAGDQNFKTFDAAFPYVVQKLLTDNSAPSRKILHSVIFNGRKELQWQKIALFLRAGANRKGLKWNTATHLETSLEKAPTGRNGSFDVANLVFRLLPSKDGAVLRRLLMTADGASLVRSMVSKDALFFRKQVGMTLADVLYQWMNQCLEKSNAIKSRMNIASGLHHVQKGPSSEISVSLHDYQSVTRDRRLKLIFFKALESARRQPLLMVRLCTASLVVFVTAFTVACHRMLVTWSEKCMASMSFSPRIVAFS